MNTAQDLSDATAKSLTLWSGADVAKDWFDAALWPVDQPIDVREMRRLPVRRFARTAQGTTEFFAWAEAALGATPRVVMEATGSYSPQLADWMLAQRPACQPAIVNPRTAKNYIATLEPRNNTDPIAARALARYGVERAPAPYEPLTPERRALRELTRYRVHVVEQRQAQQLRLGEGVSDPVVRRMIADDVRRLKRQEKRLKDEIRVRAANSPTLGRDIALLRTIYGVDWIVAGTVVAELGDLRRFQRARQLTAFAGLAAGRKESGKSVRGRARMCKMGSSTVRRALCMSARCAVRGQNDWADQYRRMVAEGKSKRSAEGAIMRKILVAMRAMLIGETAYQPRHRAPVNNCQKGCAEKVHKT